MTSRIRSYWFLSFLSRSSYSRLNWTSIRLTGRPGLSSALVRCFLFTPYLPPPSKSKDLLSAFIVETEFLLFLREAGVMLRGDRRPIPVSWRDGLWPKLNLELLSPWSTWARRPRGLPSMHSFLRLAFARSSKIVGGFGSMWNLTRSLLCWLRLVVLKRI